MTVESTPTGIVYTVTNGASGQEYPINFPYIAAADVRAYYAPPGASRDASVELVYGTDYSVSEQVFTTLTELPAGAILAMYRDTPLTKDILWVSGQPSIMKADDTFCDRGFRGRKKVNGAAIILPESPSPKSTEHFKRKAQKNFGRRSAIEPVIGHLTSDFRLARNYLKGTIGDAVNLLLAAAAFNCRKWMRAVTERLLFILCTLWAMVSPNDEYKTLNA